MAVYTLRKPQTGQNNVFENSSCLNQKGEVPCIFPNGRAQYDTVRPDNFTAPNTENYLACTDCSHMCTAEAKTDSASLVPLTFLVG